MEPRLLNDVSGTYHGACKRGTEGERPRLLHDPFFAAPKSLENALLPLRPTFTGSW